MSSRKFLAGVSTWVLYLVGLLILLVLFLSGKASGVKSKIKSILTNKGYSPRMADWWIAVSNFETGKWTSDLYREENNLFGMKHPMKRLTLSRGPTGPGGFASFINQEHSIKDLILYMEEFNYPKDFNSLPEMIAFMKDKGYFEEPYDVYLAGVTSRL